MLNDTKRSHADINTGGFSKMTSRTAVLCDHHPLILDAVERVLTSLNVEVRGRATSPGEALAAIEEFRPELLVAEIATPEGEIDGISFLRLALERVPELKIIVLSAYDDARRINQALAAGAAAYVLKTAHPGDFASAVRQAFEHSIYLREPIPSRFHGSPDLPALTRREHEILQLAAEGRSNAELAKMLWVTEQTVKFHLSNIYRKLGVSNRTEASRWALMHSSVSQPAVSALPTSAV